MSSKGFVLSERAYIGSVSPPATFEDESRFGNVGTHTNVTWVKLPSGLWVRSFAGDGYVDCGNKVALQIVHPTMIVWFRATTIDRAQSIVAMPYDDGAVWDTPYIAYSIHIAANNTLVVNINYGGTYIGLTSGVTVTADTWYQVASAYDGETLRSFVDGAAWAISTTPSGDITYSGSPKLAIGVHSIDSLGEYFIGDIALTKVLNHVLSAEQMAAIFQSEKHWFGV